MMYSCEYRSPLGDLLLASDGESLTGLWIKGQKYFAASLGKDAERRELPVFAQARKWLDLYFAGEQPGDLPKLNLQGTAFQRLVWQELLKIPYGQVESYGEITKRLERETGKRSAARAVGSAVGRNPISILVPCHRVVGASGSLTGYAGGIPNKIALLKLEGIDVGRFSVPKKGTAL